VLSSDTEIGMMALSDRHKQRLESDTVISNPPPNRRSSRFGRHSHSGVPPLADSSTGRKTRDSTRGSPADTDLGPTGQDTSGDAIDGAEESDSEVCAFVILEPILESPMLYSHSPQKGVIWTSPRLRGNPCTSLPVYMAI
jgi:hypothetical protein